MSDPIAASPVDLAMIKAMIEGRHINYMGLLKLRTALTSDEIVRGWHASLSLPREAVLALITDAINEAEVEVARINRAAGLRAFNEADRDD